MIDGKCNAYVLFHLPGKENALNLKVLSQESRYI